MSHPKTIDELILEVKDLEALLAAHPDHRGIGRDLEFTRDIRTAVEEEGLSAQDFVYNNFDTESEEFSQIIMIALWADGEGGSQPSTSWKEQLKG